MFRFRTFMLSFTVLCVVAAVDAEDEPPGAKAAAADPYKVPVTDDTTILADFIEAIRKDRPETLADIVALESKMPAVMEAANRILSLEQDKSSKPYSIAKHLVLKRVEITKVAQRGTLDQKRALLQEVISLINDSDKSEDDALLASKLASSLENWGGKPLAMEAYEKLGQLLISSADENVVRRGQKMLGAVRRSQLIGQPMQLTGKTLDGQPFDLKSLSGKVVLVDFWSTTCGPCIMEIPGIKQEYERYKAKGFEVVGVSLDRDRDALVKFVGGKHTHQGGVPWIILYDEDRADQHPAAIEYGVIAIPTMILLGRDGNIVSTTARGDELPRLLKQLFSEKDSR